MAHYIDKDALVAEIEKLIERAKAERVLHPKTILAAKNYLLIEDYNKLLSFIDTLEVKEVDFDFQRFAKLVEENVSECKIIPRPIECDSKCNECPFSTKSEPISEELTKELDKFLKLYGPMATMERCASHFANWQERKDTSMLVNAYDNGYNTAKEEVKQQMMKDAVESQVCINSDADKMIERKVIKEAVREFNVGDKVKLIIIKED